MKKVSTVALLLTLAYGCLARRASAAELVRMNFAESTAQNPDRIHKLERVEAVNIVQLYADGFERLSLREKTFAYYLYLAALAGRDISIDQHHSDGLAVRELFEQVYTHNKGIEPRVFRQIEAYLKLFWVNNGFYDDVSLRKFAPECTYEEFKSAVETATANGGRLDKMEPLADRLLRLKGVIFDRDYQPVLTTKSPGNDFIAASAVHFYGQGLTYAEVDAWARSGKERYPLNSMVVKEKEKIVERVWRAGGAGVPPGMYAQELGGVIGYLEKAMPFASSEAQSETIRRLIQYLRTGKPGDYRRFNIQWVKDNSNVDFIMGFIEVYLDPRGQKGEWEAAVFYTDPEQTLLMQNLAKHAQYFEEAAPWSDEYKKKIDRSPIANVIDVAVGTGGTGPTMPIGINLPNDEELRRNFGTKSVLLHNVVEASEKSQGSVLTSEFAWSTDEIERQKKYGSRADNLHTAMHEVIGHGSGKASERLQAKDPADVLPGYYNTLEEARADLMALWNAFDKRLVEMGWAKDLTEVEGIGQTMYEQQVRAALVQLRRIGKSTELAEDHLKNRALIGNYLIRHSNAVKVERRDEKTYYHLVEVVQARKTVGELLAEVMRIKAEGDLDAAKKLIDTYALRVDIKLRDEVQERARKLDVASYMGLVMPKLEPVIDREGKITDVQVSYPQDFAKQMLEYSEFTRREQTKSADGRKGRNTP